jgi:uncharacterized membrane protein YkvA (DUF1232 family)
MSETSQSRETETSETGTPETESSRTEPQAGPEVEAVVVLDDLEVPAEHHHLLEAYDHIRQKVLAAVERKTGRLAGDAVKVLLLVPDIFLLLVRLTFDKEVPASTRALIGSVLAYFLLPFDLFPEALVGGAGYLDDVVLATAVLAQAFGGELEQHARKHWSGPEDLRVVLGDVSQAANHLLGGRTHSRLRRLLERRAEKKEKDPKTDEE